MWAWICFGVHIFHMVPKTCYVMISLFYSSHMWMLESVAYVVLNSVSVGPYNCIGHKEKSHFDMVPLMFK